MQPWASCSHTCASVTKQYNLVQAQGKWAPSLRSIWSRATLPLPYQRQYDMSQVTNSFSLLPNTNSRYLFLLYYHH